MKIAIQLARKTLQCLVTCLAVSIVTAFCCGCAGSSSDAPKTSAPAIQTQPQSQSLADGATATFTVVASGTAPLSYQWAQNGSPITGATSATLTLASATAASAGSYAVIVSNPYGSITSSAATLTVLVAPSIQTQPQSQTLIAGATATFTVIASGTAPLTYQWTQNGNAIAGATNATLTLTSLTATNAGSYAVTVNNPYGTASSNAATLTVLLPPSIQTQPQSQTLAAGANATFTVVASGTAPLSYQWMQNGSAIIGATSATLTLTSLTAGNAGTYAVTVTNPYGSITSNGATLTVLVPPSIQIQPSSQSVPSGSSISFSVSASGSGSLSYQWYQNGVSISGATGSTLSLSSVTSSNSGSYTVTVSNSYGSVTSIPATLTVIYGVPALALYPDLLNPIGPSSNPSLPSAFDPFTPPVSSVAAAAGVPTIAEYTRQATPGDSVVVTAQGLSTFTGSALGKDTSFVTFGETATGSVLASGSIPALESNIATVTTSSQLPAGGVYFLWPGNANGFNQPSLINAAEAWWVGPDVATAGQTVTLYGRNLSYHSGTTSAWIYIQPSSGTGQWATVTAVNPYAVQFAVPRGLANGSYQIWAHNGGGGKYGWSGPITLTVESPIPWTATTFNVKSAPYDATGNGTTDDTAAIKSAIAAAAASPYSTVYFPTGTYLISSQIQMPSNIQMTGQGATSSILEGGSANLASGGGAVLTFGPATGGIITSPVTNVVLQNLGINVSASTTGLNMALDGSVSNLSLTNVNLTNLAGYNTTATAPGQYTTYLDGDHIFINGCNNYGGSMYIENPGKTPAYQVFINNTNFYGANDRPLFHNNSGMSEFAATGNTAQDYNNSVTTGWAQGPWWKWLNTTAAESNFYFNNNTSYALGVRPGLANQNWGEQINWEQNWSFFAAAPTPNTNISASVQSATVTTVTFSAAPPVPAGTNQYMAAIINGTGLGQWRMITAYSGDTITVSPAWNVPPDTTSTISIGAFVQHEAIYQNSLQGKEEDVTTTDTNSTGILGYGGTFDLVADNNTMSTLYKGIADDTIPERTSSINYFQPMYFNLFINNTINNTGIGFFMAGGTTVTDATPANYMLGAIGRNNNITGTYTQGLSFYDPSNETTTDHWEDMNVFERSSITNTPWAVRLEPLYLGNFLLLNNTFSLGTASSSGSEGISFAGTTQWPVLQNNQWNTFATTYNGTSRGGYLAAITPSITVTLPTGGSSVNTTFPLWNVGDASLSWTATSSATWLTLVTSSGSITPQASATLTTTVNPTGLAAGTYAGTITITNATQTTQITVNAIVN